MKKILIAIFILCSVQSFGQATFRIKDSTLRFMTGTLTSKVPQFVRPMYGQELSRNNSGTLKMMVLDTARAALGLKAWYWQDIPAGGSGGGGGGTPGGSNKQFQYNNSSSFGGSGNLTQETNQVLLTGSSTSVVPFRITPASGATVSAFRVDNYLGDSVLTVDPTGNAYIGKQTSLNYTRTLTFAYGLNAYSTAGFRIKDVANGNGVVLNASSGGYLDIRDISGIGGGISALNWNNPSTGNKITTGSNGFTFNDPIVMGSARLSKKQGADVTSANNLTLGSDGNTFEITGTTQVNLIANTNWQNGSEITLFLASGITVKHGQATSGSNITISLSGAADLVTAAETALTLVLSEVGGTQKWRQKGAAISY